MEVEGFSFPSLTNVQSQGSSELQNSSPMLIPEQPPAQPHGGTREAHPHAPMEEHEMTHEGVQEEHFSHCNEEDAQLVSLDEPFDDMVVLEDGIVSVPASSDPIGDVMGSSVLPETAVECLGIPEIPSQAPEAISEDIHPQQPNSLTDEILEVEDNCMLHEITPDQKYDSKPPAEELPSEKVRESLTTEMKQNMVNSGSLKDEEPGKSIHEPEILANAFTDEMPQADSEIKQTQHTEEATNLELPQQEAEALIGRRVVKKFGTRDFLGEITGYDPEEKWFKIVYEDLDEEDLEWVEIKPLLLSADSTKLTVRPRPMKKKRDSAGTSEDGDERTPKKTKKSAVGMVSVKKTPASQRKMNSSRKKTPGSKAKGSMSTSAKKLSSKKKSKEAKVKSPGKKNKQKEMNAESYRTPEKSPKEKGMKGKETTAGKSTIVGKSSKSSKKKDQGLKSFEVQEFEQEIHSILKTAKKGVKGSQFKSASQKHTGTKQKADMDETRVSLGKRLKQVATGNLPDFAEAYSPCRSPLSQGKVVELRGESLVGRLIRKKFGGKLYNGNVVSFDEKSAFYKVLYEDGDQEDLEWHELEPVLISEQKRDTPRPTSRKKKIKSGKNKSQTEADE